MREASFDAAKGGSLRTRKACQERVLRGRGTANGSVADESEQAAADQGGEPKGERGGAGQAKAGR